MFGHKKPNDSLIFACPMAPREAGFSRQGVITMAAARLISLLFTQQELPCLRRLAVGIVGNVSTFDTNGMQLGYVFSFSQQVRHLAKRFSQVVHIKTGDDHPDATNRKLVADFRQSVVEELGLVDADDIDLPRQ